MLFSWLGSLPSLLPPSSDQGLTLRSPLPSLTEVLSALCCLLGLLSLVPWPQHPCGEQSWGPTAPAPAPDLSLLHPQAALQVGGHGERLTQCREVVLTTSKAIPVQVDGEPCKLAASRIRIALRNQATMVQKAKRRSTAPLHSEYVPLPATTCPGPEARLCPSLEPRFPQLERGLRIPLPWGGGAGSPGLAPGRGPFPSALLPPVPQPAARARAAADPGEQGQHARLRGPALRQGAAALERI